MPDCLTPVLLTFDAILWLHVGLLLLKVLS